MEKLENKKILLNNIHLPDGAPFEYDEKAILNEYAVDDENRSNMAIKVLSILGGFLATFTFLGFLFTAGLYDSEVAILIFGILFISFSVLLNKVYDRLIIDTFCISMYVIGLILVSYSLGHMKIDDNIISILIIIIAFISLFITQNYILSFISVLLIASTLYFLIISNEFDNLIHLYITINTLILSYLFLNEAKIISLNKKLSKLYNPVRIALIFSLLFALSSILRGYLLPKSENYILISSVVMISVIMYLVYIISKITGVKSLKSKILIYSLACLILSSVIFAPSIYGAMLIILLSFLVNYKTGLSIGIISLVYFISQYYYDLSFTLLTKSIILFSSGIGFLLFYLLITKKLSTNEKI